MAGQSQTQSTVERDTVDALADLGEAVTDAKDQIQDQVGSLTDQVRQQATEQFATQKERLVDTLDTIALLLHQAGEHATKDDKNMLASYADKASEQVNQWSGKLREHEATQLLEETKQLATRQPLLFFGGALAAGFVGSRFFRSSAQQAAAAPKATSDTTTSQDSSENPDASSAEDATELATYDASLGAPLDTNMTMASEMTPDETGFLEDYESETVSEEEVDTMSLRELDELTSPEKL